MTADEFLTQEGYDQNVTRSRVKLCDLMEKFATLKRKEFYNEGIRTAAYTAMVTIGYKSSTGLVVMPEAHPEVAYCQVDKQSILNLIEE